MFIISLQVIGYLLWANYCCRQNGERQRIAKKNMPLVFVRLSSLARKIYHTSHFREVRHDTDAQD